MGPISLPVSWHSPDLCDVVAAVQTILQLHLALIPEATHVSHIFGVLNEICDYFRHTHMHSTDIMKYALCFVLKMTVNFSNFN